MRSLFTASLAATALLAGAAVTAGPVAGSINAAFGAPATAIGVEDVRGDAEALFAKVDVDQSGDLDIEEFASHVVVLAELARFSGLVALDGPVPQQISLPTGMAPRMAPTERAAIDAVARRTFFDHAAGGTMAADSYVSYRLSVMAKADGNGDGVLEGPELTRFAVHVTKPALPKG